MSCARFFADPFSEVYRTCADELVVQQRQRLRRDGGVFAPTATGLRIRSIECLHQWILHDTFVKHVDAAPARGRGIFQVLGIRVRHVPRLNGFGRNGRFHGRAEHLRIQRPADRQHGVA